MRTWNRHIIVAISTLLLLGHIGTAQASLCLGECGAIITIQNAGSSVTFTGVGPYDGIDDTMIGIVNHSSHSVSVIGLQSTTDIFGFDGDGIHNKLGAPSNPLDSTGYGGPNSYFSNISQDDTSGIVHFITPLAQQGGTSYFGLENSLHPPTTIFSVPTVNGNPVSTLPSPVPLPPSVMLFGIGISLLLVTLWCQRKNQPVV